MCSNWMSSALLLHCSRRNYGNDEEVESTMMSTRQYTQSVNVWLQRSMNTFIRRNKQTLKR